MVTGLICDLQCNFKPKAWRPPSNAGILQVLWQDLTPEAVILNGYNFVFSRFFFANLSKESRWNAFGRSSDKKNEMSFFRLDLARASFINFIPKVSKKYCNLAVIYNFYSAFNAFYM